MRRASLLAAGLAVVPLGLLAAARTGPTATRKETQLADGQGFVGSWRLAVHEAEGPPTLGLATFGADRTVVTAEHPVVTPPIAPAVVFTSSGHGAWEPTGPNTAIVAFVGLGGDGQGGLFGTVTARASITLGTAGQAFSGEVVWTIADPGGNPLATYPGTLQATRIVAEAPGSPVAGTPG